TCSRRCAHGCATTPRPSSRSPRWNCARSRCRGWASCWWTRERTLAEHTGGGMTGITTHILDLTAGAPAAGVAVTLEQATVTGWSVLSRATTDADGRVRDAFAVVPAAGRYRLTFATGVWFAARGVECFHPEVTVVFEVRDAARHHHVPLLLSPFGYSTYRGS